ncbi:apolipoprotein Eb-like isoform X2 [Narcine bancroftii]
MKFIATILILGLITAAWGDQEPAESEWEKAVEQFWNLASKVGFSAKNMPWSSETDGKFRELITETLTQLNVSSEQLQARLGPYSKQFQADLELLRARLEKDLESVRSSLQNYHEEAQLLLQQNLDDVRRISGVYMNKYRKRLSRDRAEIRRKFQEYRELLESQQQRAVEGLREAIDPMVAAATGQFQKRVKALADDLRQRTSEIKSLTQSLQKHAAANTEELGEVVSRVLTAIQSWFQTEPQRVSSYLQSLLNSAQELPKEQNA